MLKFWVAGSPLILSIRIRYHAAGFGESCDTGRVLR